MTSPTKNERSLFAVILRRTALVLKIISCSALAILLLLFAGLWIHSSLIRTEAVWLYWNRNIGYAKTYTEGVCATLFLNDNGYRSAALSREVDPHLAAGSPPRADFYKTDPRDFGLNLLAVSFNVSPPLEPYKPWGATGKVRVITVSVNYGLFLMFDLLALAIICFWRRLVSLIPRRYRYGKKRRGAPETPSQDTSAEMLVSAGH